MDSLHNECCLFNCGLWPLGRHWPHKLTNLSGECTLCLPTKSVSVRSCCQSLPCSVWLGQPWVLFSLLLFPLTSCADVQAHSGSVPQHCGLQRWPPAHVVPLPRLFTLLLWNASSVFLERRVMREPWSSPAEQSSSGATVSPVVLIQPGRWCLGLPWDTFTLCSTSGFPSPPKHLLERCCGGESSLIVNQNTEILKPNSYDSTHAVVMQFEFCHFPSPLGWSFVTGFWSCYYW